MTQVRTHVLSCGDQLAALRLIGQLNSGQLAIDIDFYAKRVLSLWSHTPHIIGHLSLAHPAASPGRPQSRALVSAGHQLLATVSVQDLGPLRNSACVLDVRNCSKAEHAKLAATVAPVRCLHCPVSRLVRPTQPPAASGAPRSDGGGAERGVASARNGLQPPPPGADDCVGGFSQLRGCGDADDYERHVESVAPHVWAVKGVCLALYGGGDVTAGDKQLRAARDVLMRARFFCLCALHVPHVSSR